jgi:hypothetical protein
MPGTHDANTWEPGACTSESTGVAHKPPSIDQQLVIMRAISPPIGRIESVSGGQPDRSVPHGSVVDRGCVGRAGYSAPTTGGVGHGASPRRRRGRRERRGRRRRWGRPRTITAGRRSTTFPPKVRRIAGPVGHRRVHGGVGGRDADEVDVGQGQVGAPASRRSRTRPLGIFPYPAAALGAMSTARPSSSPTLTSRWRLASGRVPSCRYGGTLLSSLGCNDDGARSGAGSCACCDEFSTRGSSIPGDAVVARTEAAT